jgi:hypothetical protein
MTINLLKQMTMNEQLKTKGMMSIPPSNHITILIGANINTMDVAATAQDQVAIAWDRAGIPNTPTRFNVDDDKAILEMVTPDDIDREFARQIAESLLGEALCFIEFDTQDD